MTTAKGLSAGIGWADADGQALWPISTASYSLQIRDTFFNALSTTPFFQHYTCRRTKMLRIQHELLPYLGVYLIDDPMVPDGDGNAGEIRFLHNLRIGFSVMVANNDQDALEAQLDAAYNAITGRLWPDQFIMNVADTYDPATHWRNVGDVKIESIERGMRKHVWGLAALNNETPVGELQYDVTCRHREGFPPVITDDLLLIDVKTGIKPGDTQDEMHRRLQIERQYAFDPSSFAAKREFKQRRKTYGR
jgi:hypothetical protein